MSTQEDSEFVQRLSERTESIGINLDREPVQEYQYRKTITKLMYHIHKA